MLGSLAIGFGNHPHMRVLIVHELYPPDIAGGGEYIVQDIAQGLRRSGATVSVLTTGNPEDDDTDGIPVTRLPISRYRLNLEVARVVRAARDADVIQTFNYHACLPAYIAARYLGMPIVCELLGLFTDEWLALKGPLAGRAFRIWERLLLRLPFDRAVFLSDFSADLAVQLGVPRERCVVNVPGISHDDYYSAPEKDVDVLFLGKLTTRKGVYDVLAVAEALPDLRFRVVGWGDDAESIKATAPPNVTVDGGTEPFDRGPFLFDALATARIFLFPSRAETFGLVIAEAMASGCAVVSSVPLPFAGERIVPGDIAGIADAIRRLAEDPAETAALGTANIERAKMYSWDRHVETLLQTYHQLLSGARPVGGES